MVVLLQWFRSGGLAAEQLLDARDVVLGDVGVPGQASGHLGGLDLQVVTLAGLRAHQLARAGHREPLARAGVRLVLRHRSLFLSWYVVWSRRARSHVGLPAGTEAPLSAASLSSKSGW